MSGDIRSHVQDAPEEAPPCRGCATANRPQARFCRHCGRPLATTARDGARRRAHPPTGERPALVAPTLALVVLVLVLVLVPVLVGSAPRLGSSEGRRPSSPPATTDTAAVERLEAPTDLRLRLVGASCRGRTCLLEVDFTDRSIDEGGHRVRFAPRTGPVTTEEVPAVPGTGGRLRLAQTVPADDVVCVQVRTQAGGRSRAGAPRCVLVTDAAAVPGEDLRLPLDLAVGTCARPGPGQELAGARPWLRPVPCGPAADIEVYRRGRIPRSEAAAAHCREDAPGVGRFQVWWGNDDGVLTVVCAWRR